MTPERVFVIAEAGSCHDGDLEKALALVDLAARVGADACKFQWVSSPERLASRRRVQALPEAYGTIAFPRAWFAALAARCVARGIEFMCTAYIPEDISVVAEYVRRFKVASFEATDGHFVSMHAEYKKPLIMSAGMATAEEVGAAVSAYVRASSRLKYPTWSPAGGVTMPWVSVLQCVSAYPCPIEQAGIGVISSGGGWNMGTGPFYGYSDHTTHPWTGALAVAAGARIVEFHMRLDATSPRCADWVVSRNPAEAGAYVRHVRLAELMLGDGRKRAQPAEIQSLQSRVISGS